MSETDETSDTIQSAGGTLRSEAGIIAHLVTIFFINMLSRLGMAPLLPGMEAELGLSHAQAGSLFLLISVGYGSGLFLSPFLSAKVCHRHVIVISSAAVGAALLACSWSTGPWTLRFFLMVLGFTGGLYLPSGVAAITAAVRKGDWGKVLSIHQLAPNLAYISSPLFADLMLHWYTWRVVLRSYGAASLVLALVFLRSGKAGDYCGMPPSTRAFGTLLRNRSVWVLIAIFSLALSVNQGVFSMMPLYLTTERGYDLSWSNHLIMYSRIIAFGFPLLSGWAADKFGLIRVMFIVVLFSSLATMAVVLAPGGWIGLGLVFQAISSVCFFPLGFAAMSRMTDTETRNIAVALVIPAAHFLGAGIVPTAVGAAGDHLSFGAGFALLAGLTFVGLYLLRYLKTD